MQTTLRIDDDLYREAKAEAARQGTTLTRFLEEGLRLQLKKEVSSSRHPHSFRVCSKGGADSRSWAETVKIAEEEQVKQDLEKMGLKVSDGALPS